MVYRQLVGAASQAIGRKIRYTVLPRAVFVAGARFVPALREASELLPRCRGDNLFDTSRFAERFPRFRVTTYRQGIEEILTGS